MSVRLFNSGAGFRGSINTWMRLFEGTNESNLHTLIGDVSILNRAMNIRTDALVGIRHHIENEDGVRIKTDGLFDVDQVISDVAWNLAVDGYVIGEILPNGGVQVLNGNVAVQWDNLGRVMSVEPEIPRRFLITGKWNPARGNYHSEVRSVRGEAETLRNISQFSSSFFKNGAILSFILKSDRNVGADERTRIRGAIRRLAQGVQRAWNVLILRKGMDIETIQSDLSELALDDLYNQNRAGVLAGMGVPEDLIFADAANYATALAHATAFFRDTVIPLAEKVTKALNSQIFSTVGWKLVYDYNSIEALQREQANQTDAIVSQLQAGIIDKNEAREQLGYSRIDESEMVDAAEDVDVDADFGDISTADMARAIRAEVKAWRRKCRNRDELAEFDSDIIPPDLHESIRTSDLPYEIAFKAVLSDDEDFESGVSELEDELRKRAELYRDYVTQVTGGVL